MRWPLQLTIDPGSRVPLTAQIADGVVAGIRSGRLRTEQRLPGSRALAQALSVSRNTVVAAYEELTAQGWLRMTRGSGAFVCAVMPTVVSARGERNWSQLGFDLRPKVPRDLRGSRDDLRIVWDWGIPDARIAPIAEIARAYRHALTPETIGYGRLDGRRTSRLQQCLAEMLSLTRGHPVPAANVLTTRGSLMALYLVARVLVRPGDVVAIEEPGYDSGWKQLQLAGAEIAPLPVDAEGVSVSALRKLCARRRVRAIFVTPHHQFPTTVTLSASRRVELLQLAQEQRIAVIEDDCDHEFHYDGRPVPPLFNSDPAGNVIYVGSLSKILAPGLRLGYVVAPAALIAELASFRQLIDREGDKPLEAAIAELFDDGTLARHYNRSRRVYRARRDALFEMLQRKLGGALELTLPHGGMAIWARVDPGVDVEAWAARAFEQGLFFRTGRLFYLDHAPRQFVRLGFACMDEAELEVAVARMARALR